MQIEGRIMGTIIGISDDCRYVTLTLTENGTQLGWLALTPEQVDNITRGMQHYKNIVEKLAASEAAGQRPIDRTLNS